MHSRVPPLGLALCVLTVTPGLLADEETKPGVAPLEIIPAVVAPFREAEAPVPGAPEPPAPIPEDPPGPVVARRTAEADPKQQRDHR